MKRPAFRLGLRLGLSTLILLITKDLNIVALFLEKPTVVNLWAYPVHLGWVCSTNGVSGRAFIPLLAVLVTDDTHIGIAVHWVHG